MKPLIGRILQSIFSVLFVIMTIGSGYLFMAGVERMDRRLSVEEHRGQGRQALWHGTLPLHEELNKMIAKSRASGDREGEMLYAAALHSLAKGTGVSLAVLPVSPFLLWCAPAAALAALAILVLSRYVKHDAIQTLMGILAGLMIWITAEQGLIMASRRIGIARRLEIMNGSIAGSRGEFLLLEYSWVFLLPVLLYLLFQESVRCPFFLYPRRLFRLMRGPVAAGRIDNYAPRVAFFYFSAIWVFYVVLLLAFDETIFGVHSWFTFTFFILCLFGAGYLSYRIFQKVGLGANLRYAIGVALVFWSTLEILIKWDKLGAPWTNWGPVSISLIPAALCLSGFVIIRQVRKGRGARDAA